MSLFYSMVFYLLIAEIAFTTVLLLPLPLSWKSWLFKKLSSSKFNQFRNGLKISLVFIGLLFIDSINKAKSLKSESGSGKKDAQTDAYLHAKMFYAQRNIYLTGATIFLALVLIRFFSMILDLVKQEEKAFVLKSQATKTSKEYMKLIDSESEKDLEISELKDKISSLESKLKDYDILKKQADSVNSEYMKLIDKVAELENKGNRESKKDL